MANTLTPTAKVTSGTAAGAVTIVLVWIAGMIGIEVPPEVASAVTVLIGFGVAYLVPDGSSDGKHVAE